MFLCESYELHTIDERAESEKCHQILNRLITTTLPIGKFKKKKSERIKKVRESVILLMKRCFF